MQIQNFLLAIKGPFAKISVDVISSPFLNAFHILPINSNLYGFSVAKEMHSLTSFFKTPLTDISGCVFTHQNFGYCRDMEMKVVNCLEAYGQDRGLITCKDLVDDYHECYLKFKQDARRRALLQERQKQNVYEPPPREDALS